ncbi:MAG: MG2 domain-containing protein, partial [Fibrobacteria bacterium]
MSISGSQASEAFHSRPGKNRLPRLSLSAACGLCAILLLLGCVKQEKVAAPKVDPAMAALVSAFSANEVSADGPIRVQMVNPVVDSAKINKVLDKSPLEFSPSIKGSAVWTDDRTLEFRPAGRMERGKVYTAELHLDRFMQVPEKLRVFGFSFTAMKQFFERDIGALQAMDEKQLELQRASGVLRLSDGEDGPVVEKILSATQDGRILAVHWEHSIDRREHAFRVDSLRRGEDSSRVILSWNGDAIGTDQDAKDNIRIPSINEFSVVEVAAGKGEDRYISVHFSDPPQKGMDFRGLIEIPEQGGLRFQAEGNEIRVYSGNAWSGGKTVQVSAGIKNGFGKALKNPGAFPVAFEEIKPGVRFVGKGVILPGEENLTLPFEAVNLRSVRVNVVRIFSGNVPQFLQVNDFDGENELQRVGRSIWSKTVDLNPTPSIRQRWARYALDLGDLVKKEEQPGSLYRITLSFTRGQSLYPCADSANIAAEEEQAARNWDDDLQIQSSGWDGIEQWQEDDGGYEWSERDDPCSKSYYNSYYNSGDRKAARNFLPSNIGLMAKSGRPGRLLIVASDLKTALPMADADLQVLNYQHQVLAKGKTDKDGFADLEPSGKAFLLTASKGNQRGYLKVDERAALQMGRFDVGGLAVQEGLKGCLFGERGVWRPGDSLYLTFILEDKQGRLPAGHPLSFELHDPQGRVVRSLTRASAGAFYSFATATDPDAPTGDYTARVKAGPAVFEERLKIENVMPNRMKIRIDFNPKPLRKDAPVSGNLEVTWLSGAIARHLEAEVEMTLQAVSPDFRIFADHVFTDPVRRFETESQTLFQGRIDANGKASFSHPVKVSGKAPGMLRANFRTRVLEAGGGFSIDRLSQPFHPYSAYVGIKLPAGDQARGMLLTDTTHAIHFAVLDTDGRKVAKRKIEVKLTKIEWKWWWEKEDQNANYISEEGGHVLQSGIVTINDGEGSWGLKLKYPEWGRYLVRACDMDGGAGTGHCTGKIIYMDWPGWAGRAQREGPGGGAAVLAFSADKQKYNVGEKVRINIPSPQAGRALVSIEKGGQVLKRYWLALQPKETAHEFEVTREMAPNVYVYVALLQPHEQTVNDLPMRMYNVIPIQVEDPATRLRPELNVSPAVFRPGEKAEINVSEANGKPMQYVVAAVDEGLLDLTRFLTPDPWEKFYAREALGIRTWDMFDFVAGAYGGRLERLLAIGGDEGLKAPEGRKGNRFPPMVRFLGPFTLEKGKRAKHSLDIPQYVGSVRVMVIAAGDGAYGMAEKPVPVRKPLMVLGTLPRILAPDEKVELPVSVFALEKKVREVEVELTASGPLKIAGGRTRKLTFKEPSDELVAFKLESGQAVGWAKVVIKAKGGGENAEQTIEIQVRNPNAPVTDVHQTVLQPGQGWSEDVKLPGVKGTNKATLELSRIPPLDLEKRLGYLLHYPYGCLEQTTSSVFPQLFLDGLMDLAPQTKAGIENNIKAGIERLRGFQNSGGGFGFWPDGGENNPWGTNYAGHFLLEAERLGYGVPAGMLDQWKKYQKAQAQGWNETGSYQEQLTQAYRLYTLALAGSAEIGAMNRLKETKNLPPTVRWQLGGAYQLAGQAEAAASLVQGGTDGVKAYHEQAGTFGSDLRDKAMMLEILSLMGRRSEGAKLMKEIAGKLSDASWQSTQTTAYALLAVARFQGKAVDRKSPTEYGFKLNGQAADGRFDSPLMQQDVRLVDGKVNQAELVNKSKGELYARLLVRGLPAMGQETAAENGIRLAIAYKDMQGQDLNPDNLDQGSDFIAEYHVSNADSHGALKQLALASVFPSGWEIRNTRMDPAMVRPQGKGAAKADSKTQSRTHSKTDTATDSPSSFDYQDFRDDRVHTFFDLEAGGRKLFRFYLNAAYLGKYHMPQSQVEAMYDGSINARTKGGAVIVKMSEGSDGDPNAPSRMNGGGSND